MTIKQLCLGVAVAGVVAGAGSAAGTAVAFADASGPDSSSASENTGRGGTAPGRSHSRADNNAAPAASVATPRADRTQVPAAEVEVAELPDNEPSGSAVVPSGGSNDPQPTAEAPELPTASPSVEQVSPQAAADAVQQDSGPARVNQAVPPAAAAFAPAAATDPVVTLVVPSAVAEPAVLTPAPAAPAPVPLRLPLLPDLPALPVAPVSAVTFSTTSGTNPRVRAASAVAQAAVLADPPVHVLLIGTDGTNLDKVLQYAYTDGSGFKTLMDGGITGATSIVNHTTISGPSWSTILTGAWDSKTGVINNLFRPEPYNQWPTVINLLEYNKPAIDTTVIADWKYISDIAGAGGYPADTNIYVAPVDKNFTESSAQVTADTVAKIKEIGANPDVSSFIFSYQVEVDEAGHSAGGGSEEYKQAVINVGGNIEQIMTAVKEVEEATGQDWTVIVTTDHGHQQSVGFGHGFQSPNETSSFVIFDLAGDQKNDGKQNLNYSTVDITPTIVSLFGVPQRSDFDGVPMQSDPTILESIVTPVNLKQSLNDAISMYGYPNIGNDIALGTRTVFATVPYLIDGLVTNVVDALQWVVDQDIFLISGIADVTQWIVQFNGDLLVWVTDIAARGVAYLTGSGVIPPTDPPLPAPPADSELPLLLDAAVLT